MAPAVSLHRPRRARCHGHGSWPRRGALSRIPRVPGGDGLGVRGRDVADGRTLSDHELVAHVAAGDAAALAEVYRPHSPLVFGLARRVTGDNALAEDVVQEVFVHLWRQPE